MPTELRPNAGTMGAWLESRLHLRMTEIADDLYGDGRLTRDERMTLSKALGNGLKALVKVIDADAPDLYSRSLWESPTVNSFTMTATPSGVYEEEIDGIPYLVVPAVTIVEGVMNGALVLADEFGRDATIWDDMPVVVRHPQVNGRFVSAFHPDVTHHGFTRNSRVEGEKLHNEICIDVTGVEASTDLAMIVNRVAAGDTVDLSWGWYRTPLDVNGEFDGETYTEIATNFISDHLALLPDEQGACSVARGCGAPRTNNSKTGAGWFVALQRMMKPFVNLKESIMERETMVEALIVNGYTQEMLEGASDELVSHLYKQGQNEDADAHREAQPVANAQQPDPRLDTLTRQVSELTAAVGNLVANQQARQDAAKGELVTAALASQANVLSEEALKNMPEADLQTYVNALQPTVFMGDFQPAPTVNGNAHFEAW